MYLKFELSVCKMLYVVFFTGKKTITLRQRIYIFMVNTHSEERRRVTESLLRVPLTISSLFTNLVPKLRTMAVTYSEKQYVCSKILIINKNAENTE